MNRRSWFKLGAFSLGALSPGLSPTLSTLLSANESSNSANDDFSVILFWANGGPSQLDTFDLKPEAPIEYRGPFRPIKTNVAGIEICELFPNLARLADKFSIVRSIHHNRSEHSGGSCRLLTGYSPVAANPIDAEFPEIGSVVAKHLERERHSIPPFIANTKFYGGGPAYLGAACSPYMPNPNPLTSSGANRYEPVPIYTSGDGSLNISEDGIDNLKTRSRLLTTFDRFRRELDKTGQMRAVDKFNRQAIEMLSSTATREAFDISQESDATRRMYGDTHWGRSLLTCRRLVEAGCRFVQCQATFRLRPETGRTSTWDDHSVNADIFKSYHEKLPVFDEAVPALIRDIYQRGLDQRVLFVFCGEFGRTPRIAHQDKSKRPGRDHWPQAMSVFLSGGGLRMGQVVGATNSKAEEPVDQIMNSNCLLATIYQRFGIDTSRHFLDNAGRPMPILTDGMPIRELI